MIYIFGKKMPYVGHEDDLQISVCKYVSIHKYRSEIIWTHVANERKTDVKVNKKTGRTYSNSGGKLKQKGQSKGVPDCLFFNRRGIYNGLAIELKIQRKSGGFGVISIYQKTWLEMLQSQGWFCCVCYSLDTAMWIIDQYYDLDDGEEMEVYKNAA